MDQFRNRTIDYVTGAWSWIRRSPVIVVLILILVAFNYFASESEIASLGQFRFSGQLVLDLLVAGAAQLLDPRALLVAIGGSLLAAVVTIFEMGAMFAVFQGSPRPFRRGIRAALSQATVAFGAMYAAIFAAYGVFGFVASYVVVVLFGQSGIVGGVVLLLIIAATYPVVYMVLSVCAMVAVAKINASGWATAAKLTFIPRNFRKLTIFYVVRIGSELGILLPAAAFSGYLSLPPILAGLLIIVAVSLPFAIIRTTGFIIKLEVLEPMPDFSKQFSNYYTVGRDQ